MTSDGCPTSTEANLRAEVERLRDVPHPSPEVERDWQEFWLSYTFADGYTLNDIKAELCDYHTFLQEVGKVYCEVTGDRVSMPNTKAEAVIGEYQAVLSDQIDEAVAESTEDLRAEVERLRADNERLSGEAKLAEDVIKCLAYLMGVSAEDPAALAKELGIETNDAEGQRAVDLYTGNRLNHE